MGFDLLWEFVALAPSIFGRVDDSRGGVGAVFQDALHAFEDIAPRAQVDPVALADRVWAACQDNAYGEWDGVITLMIPALGEAGLERLKALLADYADAPATSANDDHEAIQFLRQLRGGDNYAQTAKQRFVKTCLQEIAAATGDTRAYIAQFSRSGRGMRR